MPKESVRGRIRQFLEQHHDKLGDNVLEVGSRIHDPKAWYIDNRDLFSGQHLGIDMQPGENVDEVCDIHNLPQEWSNRFTGIVCSEVLEHVQRPWVAVPELYRVLQSRGYLLITTLTNFHIHGYPHDYFRYTKDGLLTLLRDAGFHKRDIHIEYMGTTVLELKNHDEQVFYKDAPLQVMAWARK